MDSILAKALGQDAVYLAAAEKRDLLARLLSRLAHEIRNPLSSLQIHVQLLEEELSEKAPPDEWQRTIGRWEIIHGELKRLDNLILQFLQLAGPSALELKPVHIEKVIHHVCELMRPEATSRGIRMETTVEEGLPVLCADEMKLTQALLNLVINALQAVQKDGLIGVRASRTPDPGLVTVQVYDTGPGVPREKVPLIFEPFFTTKSEGSGLGLWIVQQIVIAHGGTIQVTNAAQNSGAIFTCILPLQPPPRAHG